MNKGRKRIKMILIILLSIVVLLIMLSLWMASFVMTGKRQTLEDALKWQSERYDISFYDNLSKTDYTVMGFDGYILHVELLENPKKTKKYIILSHGYTDNRMGSLKYVSMYMELGYNCIIYDLRGHGENKKTFTTYGILEGRDLAYLVEDIKTRYTELTELGLHGESLGAATTIASLKYHQDVDFVVADCGFSDIENVLKRGYKNAHVPVVLFDLADIGARIQYHYSLKKMRPIDSLNDNKIPVLFIHGDKDDLIVPKNSRDMYERTRGKKKICIIQDAGHAYSVFTDPVSYKENVKLFIDSLTVSN